jgi:PAS domain S-box-containing protein
VIFVAQIIIAVGLTGQLAFANGQRAIEGLAHQLLQEVSDRISLKLQTYLATAHLISRFNVDVVEARDLNFQNLPQLERHLYKQIENFDTIDVISAANRDGVFITFSRRANQIRLLQPNPSKPDQLDEYTVDQHGNREVLSNTYIQDPADLQKRSWYQLAVEQQKAIWSPIEPMGNHQDLSLRLSVPVYDLTTSRLQGVFSTGIFISHLNSFLQTLNVVGKGGLIFVMERNGLLVGTSTSEPAYISREQNGHPEFIRVNAAESENILIRTISQDLHAQTNSFEQINKEQNFQVKSKGDRHLVSVLPFQDPDGLDWLIVTAIPESVFMDPLNANTHENLYVLGVILLGGIALATLAANWIARPIQQLSHSAQAMSHIAEQQNLACCDATTQLTANSFIAELAVMARSFNRMAQQLCQTFESINAAWLESEAKFTKMFRLSPDAISLTTLAEGRFIEVNDKFLQTYGVLREQVIGRTTFELGLWASEADRDRFRQTLEQTGTIKNLEITLHNSPDSAKTILLSADVIDIDGIDCVLTLRRDISDRKRLENELRASENKLSDVLNNVSAAIGCFRVYADQSLQEIYRSVGHQTVFGYTAEEFSADPTLWRSRVHPADLDPIDFFEQIFAECTTNFEYRFQHKDGSWRWIDETFSARRNDAEDCWIITFVEIDISDRKQLEVSLQESETRFRQIAANIHQFFFIRSAETGQFLYVSPAYETIWGRSCDSLYQNPESWLEDIHPGDRHLVQTSLKTQFQGNIVTREYRIIRTDGTIRWISAQVSPVLDEAGRVIRYVGTAEDITLRKQAEAMLQKSARIVSATPDGISLVDRHYTYTLVNQTYLRRNNKSYDEIVGHSIAEFMGQEVFETVIQPRLDRCFAGETIQYEEWFNYAVAGARFVSVTYAPYFETDGTISGAIVTSRDLTDLQQTQQAVRRLNAAMEHAIEGIAQLDLDGRYVSVNRAYVEMMGYTVEEMLGMNCLQGIHPDDLERAIASHQTMQHTGKAEIEFQGIRKDGTAFYKQVVLIPIYDSRQQQTGHYCFAKDISDRKQIEIALRESQEQLNSILNSLDDLVWSVSCKNYNLLYVSPAVSTIYGYSPADFTQNPRLWMQVIHPDDRERVEQEAKALFSLGSKDQEYRIIRADGTVCWVHARARLIYDSAGVPVRIDGITTNISDRKQIATALQESEQKFRSIFEQAGVGITLVDSQSGQYLRVNQRFCALVGYTEAELLKRTWQDITHPDDVGLQWFVRPAQSSTDPIISASREKRYVCKDGTVRWVNLTLSLVRDTANLPQYEIAVIEDIQDRKQFQQQIQDSLREKEVLLSEIHHRVKNNLQIIFSLLDLQAMRTADAQTRDALADSCSRIYSMALVHERLYRSRNFSEIGLTDYVRELTSHLLQTYRPASGMITPDIDITTTTTVSLDQAIPCGLLLNELITNALKHGFSDGRSGKLYISLTHTENQLFHLTVGNDGDTLPANFELSTTISSMGLRLVMTLVDQLNGSIQFTRGAKTCFIVTFPSASQAI